MLRYTGQSGKRYIVQSLLQEKISPNLRVHLATANNEKYILKEVSRTDYEYLQNIQHRIQDVKHIRLPYDMVPEHFIFVYRYLRSHLLSLAQRNLPLVVTKRILKSVLEGIAGLHDRDIVHCDVKANNILVDWEQKQDNLVVKSVELADLEDAVYVPPGSDIIGKQVGNLMWRSPEAHASARVNKYSDIFSFGVVCIYAVLKQLVFAVRDIDLADGEEPLAVILERQISYFADEEGLGQLLNHIGDNPWCEVLQVIKSGFNEHNPRKPFSLWVGVDEDFKSLIGGLMCFDPAKRLTAHEALAHRWFKY